MAKQNRNNATCIVCGKAYHLCIACERNKGTWKRWKAIADTENCYDIYHVLNDYNFGKISKDEARKLLEKLDLKNSYTFKDNVKKIIKEIMKNKKTVKVKDVVAEVVEETNKEVVIEEAIAEEIVEEIKEVEIENN